MGSITGRDLEGKKVKNIYRAICGMNGETLVWKRWSFLDETTVARNNHFYSLPQSVGYLS